MSKFVSNVIVFVLTSIIIFGVLIQIIPPFLKEIPNIKNGVVIFYSALMILNISFGFNLFSFKESFQDKIKSFIIKMFSGDKTI